MQMQLCAVFASIGVGAGEAQNQGLIHHLAVVAQGAKRGQTRGQPPCPQRAQGGVHARPGQAQDGDGAPPSRGGQSEDGVGV
ncbi:hypothetical protein D3C71_1495950 [compost metagenome]